MCETRKFEFEFISFSNSTRTYFEQTRTVRVSNLGSKLNFRYKARAKFLRVARNGEMAEDNNNNLRSVIWQYFDRRKIDSNIFAYCKVGCCSVKLACPTGTTTALYGHLKSYHPKESKECEKKNEELKRSKKEEKSHVVANQTTVTDLWAKKTTWPSNHSKATEINQAIGYMIASDFLPYDFVEERGFQALMKLIVPQYHVPSRTTFSRNIIPAMYQNLKRETVGRISNDFVDLPSYCFTTDTWSSRALESYISFCLVYLTGEFEMRSVALENKPFSSASHTGEAILKSLEKSIDDWSLPRNLPIYVLRDNGSNMRAAMNLSQYFIDLPCFAHTLQLTINDTVSEIEGMQSMLTKCKKIVSHYHHSIQSSQLLHAQQRQLGRDERGLIMSVATRWNSDFYMVQRLVEEKTAVSAEIADSGKVENLTTNEWKLADGYVMILSPFEQASRELCGEGYPTLSMKIPVLNGLLGNLQTFVNDAANRGSGIQLARKLIASINRRFPSYDEVRAGIGYIIN